MRARHKIYLLLLLCLIVQVAHSQFVIAKLESAAQQTCINGKCQKTEQNAKLKCLNGKCLEELFSFNDNELIQKEREFKLNSHINEPRFLKELVPSFDLDFADDVIELASVLDDDPQALYWYGNVYNDLIQ
jgi:hypothetical protein